MTNSFFYTLNEAGEVQKDTLDWLTVTVFGSDTVLINRETKVKSMSLPLRYTADSTAWVLHYDAENDDLRDTIVIFQTNTPYFLSMTCGYQMKQLITATSYTRHRLDSIAIPKSAPDIYGTENLQLFY
ncbi:MAG: calcium-binding protein P [Prevotellaceae bacterium]|nr:calcium-binding protein P [Prevotellaceae bacterium]